MTALTILIIAAGIPIYLYARRRHEGEATPRRTERQPVDFTAELRPIGGCRETAAERWGDR